MAQEKHDLLQQSDFIVRDIHQAQLLTDAKTKEFFKPFVARELNASEAATEVSCALDTMLYRIGTFQKAGLLKLTRHEKRTGRPIKYYRAVADSFFIPFDLTPYADYEERLVEQLMPAWRQVARGLAVDKSLRGQQGERLHRDAHGSVWTTRTGLLEGQLREEEVPTTTFYTDAEMTLSPARAQQLVSDLRALFKAAYEDSAPGRGDTYLLQLAFVPRRPEK